MKWVELCKAASCKPESALGDDWQTTVNAVFNHHKVKCDGALLAHILAAAVEYRAFHGFCRTQQGLCAKTD